MDTTTVLPAIYNWYDIVRGMYEDEEVYQRYSTTGQLLLTVNSINDINKTDTRLMKIMRLPYCPIANARIAPYVYSFPEE